MIQTEFIDKIYNRIGKANLNNTLKISDDIQNLYNFNEFCEALLKKCSSSVQNSPVKSEIIAKLIFKYSAMYNNEFNYNKPMLIDNFILELCTSLRSI